jgi:tetratricopeptide (TPR) repeat protein
LAAALIQAAMSAGLAPAVAPLPVIGASGAIATLVGVFAVGFRTTKMRFWYFWFVLLRWKAGTTSRSSVWGIALWALAETGVALWDRFAAAPAGTAAWAHIGGLAFGAAAGMLLGIVRDAMNTVLSEEAAVYASVGLGPVAVSRYEALQRRDPENPDHCVAHARALACADKPDTRGAAAALAKATVLMANRPRRDEAVLLYEELRSKLEPHDVDARTLLTLAEIAESAGGHPAAIGIYRDLVESFPQTREAEKARFRLPHVFLAMGREDAARQAWETFVDAHPRSDWIPYASTVLLTRS